MKKKKKIKAFVREAFDHYFEIKENKDNLNEDFVKGSLYGIRLMLNIFNRIFYASEEKVERSRHEAERG